MISSSLAAFSDLKKFSIKEKITRHLYSDVYEISKDETDSRYMANVFVKSINELPSDIISEISNEIDITSQFNHPSILKFFGYSQNDFSNEQRPVIITELAKKEIFEDINENREKIYIYIYGIASGMSYLHSHNIIHCNLTRKSILLDDSFYPKITNFNYSKKLTNGQSAYISDRFTKLNCPPEYLAPEIFTKKEYSKASDVYAFSILLNEVFSEIKPFRSDMTTLQMMKKVVNEKRRPEFNDKVPDFYKELIKKCWSENPAERPTFDEIVSILKTDPNLINDENYQNYVKFIDSSQISFNQHQEFHLFDSILNSQIESIQKVQTKNVKFDLSNFDRVGEIDIKYFGCVNQIYNKDTDEKFTTEYSDRNLDNFSENDILNLSSKLAVISQLNHPSIVKFIGYGTTDADDTLQSVIVNEFLPFGNLNYITKKNRSFQIWDDTQKLINIYGIASAMSYLHSHNILHRDLKPENIYFDDLLFPKIFGFDISIEISNNSDKKIESKIKGTPVYLSPEIYKNKEYSKSSDVYAFSLVVYQIMTNERPFNNLRNVLNIYDEVVNKNKRPEFNVAIPESYKKLIERCWSQNPTERPTFDEIIDLLKTDKSFITEKVNEEDFRKYVKFIDDSEKSFNKDNRIKLEDITNLKLEDFSKNDCSQTFRFGVLGNFETEMNNISLDFEYIDINNYEKKEVIGRGSYSKVRKVIDKRTGYEYAAKIFLIKTRKEKRHNIIMLSREINSISLINHPSVVKFIGYSPINFKNKPYPVLITELSLNRSMEDIFELIRNNQEVDEFDDTKKLINIYGIASVMSYLHSHNIIHRDLKPSNILLDDFLFPKIIDFGLSKSIPDYSINSSQTCGTVLYMAPEMSSGDHCGKPLDVYSFAFIVYEMITGVKPFATITNPFQLMREVLILKKRPEISNKVPKCYRNLIERCWGNDPKKRITFDEIIELLRTDSSFITEDVNEADFQKYINFIENYDSSIEYKPEKRKKDEEQKNKTFEKIDIYSYIDDTIEPKELYVGFRSIDLYKYEKQKPIGRGQFGTVYKVIDKQTGDIYAAKISKVYLTQCTNDDVKNLEREVKIISKLNHPSILKFIGFSPTDFKNKPKPTIITELITNGSLDRIIELERMSCGNPQWDDTKKLINIYGIAAAMKYLHQQDIVHRDLKPANILLDDYLFPKISDFGLSKNLFDDNVDDILKSGFKGTYAYSAPEIFAGQYTKAGDVYSFAIIVYEIMTNDIPYNGFNQYQLFMNVPNGFRPQFKTEIPSCYKKLIENCWENDPQKRPTFTDIVNLLKDEQEFITENVDVDEFLNYVDFIDDSVSQKKNYIDDPILNNIKNNIEIINLNHFKSDVMIENQKGIFSIYRIISKRTKVSYIAKIFQTKISKMTENMKNKLIKEVSILSQLSNNPLFVKFIGYSPINFSNSQKPIIVIERTKNENLKKILENEKNSEWNDTNKLIIIYGIAAAMKYLHSEDIIHRNLNSKSICIDEKNHPKISDFEFAKKISDDENEGFIGDYAYAAPEVFKCKYGKEGDVYAFAMIVYEILTNEKLYNGMPQYKILLQVSNGDRPNLDKFEIPCCYKKLIEDCWSQDPTKRPTFDRIVDSLKNDTQFITEKVDKTDFFNYIEYIEKIQKEQKTHIVLNQYTTCNNNNNKDQVDSIIKNEIENSQTQKNEIENENSKFMKISVDFDRIKETEDDESESLNSGFLDLKKFKQCDLLYKGDYSKTYKIMSKETDEFYSAKISTIKMNQFSRDELINLSREVNLISQLCHPSFLKFIGYSPIDFKNKRYPVIVTELASNGSLKHILETERKKIEIFGWDETKKLINIYGIASGMSYLHSKNIIHRDLNPENIFLNDYLFPKIGDFGLSTKNHNNDTMTFQSTAGMKGNPTYSSPEKLQFNDCTKSGDVYSFSFVVFEILTSEVPFEGINNKNEIFNEVVINCNRPQINENVPECYRKLIKCCWAQDQSQRPTFDEIVENLKTDSNFITEKIRKNDFLNYVEFIDESRKSFDSSKKILDLEDFIKEKSKIVEDDEIKSVKDESEESENDNQSNETKQRIVEE